MERKTFKLCITVMVIVCQIVSFAPSGTAMAAQVGSTDNELIMPQTELKSWVAPAEAVVKAIPTDSAETITPEEQAEAEKWLKEKPASVKVEPGPMTTYTFVEIYKYYDADGNFLGSKVVRNGYSAGEETAVWKDKNGAEITRIYTPPTKFDVAAEQQAGLETVFGTKPVTFTKRHDNLANSATFTYYDAAGNKIGQMRETYAQVSVSFPGTIPEQTVLSRTYYDASGKVITVADDPLKCIIPSSRPLTAEEQANYGAIFGTTPVRVVTVPLNPRLDGQGTTRKFYDKYGNLVGSVYQNVTTGHTLQTFYDKDGKQIDVATRLATLDIATAASVINALDAETAGKVLAALDISKAASIVASAAITAETAAKILSFMDPAKAAAILTNSTIVSSANSTTIYPPTITREKSASILAAMSAGKASAIIGAFTTLNIHLTVVGGEILASLPRDTAASLISGIPAANGKTAAEVQSALFSKMSHVVVAEILNSTKMSVDTASAALGVLNKTNPARVTLFLDELKKTNAVKADQIRNKINGTDPDWLNELGNMTAADAAAKIIAYVKDAATAKEVADALAKLDPLKAARIIAQSSMTAQTAAKIFDQMAAEQVAKILTATSWVLRDAVSENELSYEEYLSSQSGLTFEEYKSLCPSGRVISDVKAAAILVAMNNKKAAAVLEALPAYTAARILFAQDPKGTEPAVTNMKIIKLLSAMNPDKAAAIIESYCKSGNVITKLPPDGTPVTVPARVEQIFRKMAPGVSAAIFASDKMSVATAAAIIGEVKKGFPEKANAILNAIDAINKVKADQIRNKMDSTDPDWLKDLGNMTAADAAAKIKAYVKDAATAKQVADALAKLDPKKAAAIIFNANMTVKTAAKIFNNSDADKVAEILNAQYGGGIVLGSDALPRSIGGPNADEILTAMDPAKAAAVLASTKLAPSMAAKIINTMDTASVVKILSAMDAQKAAAILSTPRTGIAGGNALKPLIPSAKAAEILTAMETAKAAAIMNNMNAGFAALVVNALNEDTAVKILGAMDAKKIAEILVAQDDNGAVAPQYHKHWDVITADKAASLLSKLNAAKAAEVFKALPADAVKAAAIIGSDKMSVENAAKILDVIKASDLARLNSILTELDKTNRTKSDKIRTALNLPADWQEGARVYVDAYGQWGTVLFNSGEDALIIVQLENGDIAYRLFDKDKNQVLSWNCVDDWNSLATGGTNNVGLAHITGFFKEGQMSQEAYSEVIKLIFSKISEETAVAAVKNSSAEDAALMLSALDPVQAAEVLKAFLDQDFSANVASVVTLCAEMAPEKLVAVFAEMDKLGDYLTDATRIQAFADALCELDFDKAAKVLVATKAEQTIAILTAMDNDHIAGILESVAAMPQNSYTKEFSQKIKAFLQQVDAVKLAQIIASENMSVSTAVKLLRKVETSKLNAVLTEMDKVNPDKTNQIRDGLGIETKPTAPVRPPDTETNPAVWQKYYVDYLKYISGLTDLNQKQKAWEALGKDLLKLSQEHPELITAHAMASVLKDITEELKAKWRNQDDDEYAIDFTGAQADILEACLNFVKSDAFKKMSDASQNGVIWRFTGFAVELSWRSAFNETNGDLYTQIAEVYKTVLENGSTHVKAVAFVQLMHLFRVDTWGSKEGNKEVAQQILQDALKISGGLKGLMEEFAENIDDTELSADARAYVACALADMVWHRSQLNKAAGSDQITDADVISCTEKFTDFLEGINDNSIKVSGGMRDGLMHHVGSALYTLIAADKKDADFVKALSYVFSDYAKNCLLLKKEDGGSVGLQTTVINVLTNLKNISNAKQYTAFADMLNGVLMNGDFDVNAYLTNAREAIKQNGRADYEAWVSMAMARITTLHLQENTGKVSDDTIQGIISDIKGWITDKNNLLDMRVMHWQKMLYDALAGLVTELSNKKADILANSKVADDLVAIVQTIIGLKDSLVKEQATKAVDEAVTQLREKGFNNLANRIEFGFCAKSEDFMKKAWQYFDQKNYTAATAFCNEAIRLYEADALKQQASLKDFAPKGEESKYWALNDVATAYFILGNAYKEQGNKSQAKACYEAIIAKFGFAQCLDPETGYWKVAEAAKEALLALDK